MKKYSNYLEQVKDNVTDMVLFNNLTQVSEFWHEPLYEMLMNTIDTENIIDDYDLPKDTELDSEEYQEAESDYIFEMLNSVYQFYMVELNGSYNEEHERLCIFYDNEVDAYILPVFHFGTSWDYISPMD